jgi:redox-sensitive bicupin YhaK (pirin superfamily)
MSTTQTKLLRETISIASRPWLALDPWIFNSYHGRMGWSFPQHPHFGFETVTYPLPNSKGFVDHADGLGQ